MNCYRCHSALSHKSHKCDKCGQEVFSTYTAGQLSHGRRLDGCLHDEPSATDYRAMANVSSLPFSVDLRNDCSPVEDQGQIGSCVANAIVGAFEHQLKRDGKPMRDFSRMFVYYNARKILGDPSFDNGATISAGMAAMLAFGAPTESRWPYQVESYAKPPSPEVYQEAGSNVPREYARVDGLDGVKGALARRYPVVIAVNVPERVYQAAGETGMAPQPTRAEVDNIRTRNGRHALLVVGYDQNSGMLTLRNSWGEGWGDRGYFKMSMDTFNEVLAPNTTWILGRLEANDFTMVRPPRSSTAPEAPKVEGGVKDMAEKMRNEIRDGLKKDIQDSFKDIKERMKPRQGQ